MRSSLPEGVANIELNAPADAVFQDATTISDPGVVVDLIAVIVATVPPTVRLTGEVFGREKASIVFGWVVASHQVGAASAAYLAGAIRTEFGSYAPAFIAAGALCVIAAVAVLPIARTRGGAATARPV